MYKYGSSTNDMFWKLTRDNLFFKCIYTYSPDHTSEGNYKQEKQ